MLSGSRKYEIVWPSAGAAIDNSPDPRHMSTLLLTDLEKTLRLGRVLRPRLSTWREESERNSSTQRWDRRQQRIIGGPQSVGDYIVNIMVDNIRLLLIHLQAALLERYVLCAPGVSTFVEKSDIYYFIRMTRDTLDGKVAVVTGAAQGLGKATSIAFARRNAAVALVDVNESPLHEAAKELRAFGANCAVVVADLGTAAAAQQVVDETKRHLGRLDVLVNNAAVASIQPLLEITEKEWDKVFAVNVKGLFFMLQAAAKAMKETGGGRIINISSPATRMTLTNYTAYATSKAAVDYLSRTAAAALGPYNITVNTVAPGRMDTPMQRITEEKTAAAAGMDIQTFIQSRTVDIPLRRRTTPEEVAEGVVWLATQTASYVSGNRLNISGGLELD